MKKQAQFSEHIVGHKPQRETLSRLQSSDRLPSALALCGQPGIGKMLVAKEFCRSLLCETNAAQAKNSAYGGCGECRACRLIDGGNHPDFHFLKCSERDQASVESIRETISLLGLKAYAGSTRLLVFDDAEQLSVQAANILLKTAEEPGANTCLLFVTANQSKMPATLLSRCQVLFFNPLSSTDVATVLRRNGRHEASDEEDGESEAVSIEELAMLADGSPGNVESLSQNLDLWRSIQNRLPSVVTGDFQTAVGFLNEISKDKQDLPLALTLMRIFARQRMYRETNEDLRLRWALLLSNLLAAARLVAERNISGGYALNAAFGDFFGAGAAGPFMRLTNVPLMLDNVVV